MKKKNAARSVEAVILRNRQYARNAEEICRKVKVNFISAKNVNKTPMENGV